MPKAISAEIAELREEIATTSPSAFQRGRIHGRLQDIKSRVKEQESMLANSAALFFAKHPDKLSECISSIADIFTLK